MDTTLKLILLHHKRGAEFSDTKRSLVELFNISEGTDILALEKERMQWSLETFKEATAISSLRKLESEILEIENDILQGKKVPEEFADALMCLFDSAGRHGVSVTDIFRAFKTKLKINKNRVWTKNANNTYSHVKFPDSEYLKG